MKHLKAAIELRTEGHTFETLITAAALQATPTQRKFLRDSFPTLVDQATMRSADAGVPKGRPFGPFPLPDGSYTVPWEWREEEGERKVRWARIYRRTHTRPFTREQHLRREAIAAMKARLLNSTNPNI